jgi:hypothetical protein
MIEVRMRRQGCPRPGVNLLESAIAAAVKEAPRSGKMVSETFWLQIGIEARSASEECAF